MDERKRLNSINLFISPLRALALAALLAPAALRAADPPPADPPPPHLEILAEAGPGINRDPLGNPLSVVVRLYLLKDKVEFSKLSYDLVAGGRSEAELLGAEFLGKSELTLVPGALYKGREELPPETRYVGLVGLFRHPDPHYWRCLARVEPPPRPGRAVPPPKRSWIRRLFSRKPRPVPPPRNAELAFKVQDCYLHLVNPGSEPIPGQPETFRPDCSGDLIVPAGRSLLLPGLAER